MKTLFFLFCFVFCSITLQAQTPQQLIEQLLGTWSFLAVSNGMGDSTNIADAPFNEQLFVMWQDASDIGEDSLNAKIITDGIIGNEGKVFVFYDTNALLWMLDFPDQEPPRSFIVSDTMLIINDGAGYNSYFVPVAINCADLPLPIISGDVILCPNQTSVLSVPDTYNSYQWYKRPYFPSGSTPQAIAGAIAASYTVTANDDLLYYFSVEVTQDTCVLMANEVLIDQIIGLPPFAQSAGSFTIDANGNTILCNTDTLLLIMYSMANPQWYNNGSPIPGATDDTLKVTTAGNYTALGTDNCGFPTSLGVEIPVIQANTPVPIVDAVFCGDYCYVVNGSEYEHFDWYYGDYDTSLFEPIIGIDNDSVYIDDCSQCYFTFMQVVAVDSYGCSATSEPNPWGCEGIEEVYGSKISLYPNPATNFVHIENSGSQQIKQLTVVDIDGRTMISEMPNSHSPTLSVQNLPVGVYYCQIVLPNGILYRTFAKF
ncbi:MAG: T9SS type A sorting domain-containing protein [Sphingobacteriales bacterium]|nr:T9SS type A sorting domain-containing protein [Sphingobacteriales bacterium]